jgi:hypothetical protein
VTSNEGEEKFTAEAQRETEIKVMRDEGRED